MTALLIWNEVPDTIRYLVIDTDTDLYKLAVKCAGKYINIDDDDADILKLSEILNSKELHLCDQPIIGPFATVIVCGFVT